MTYRHIVIDTRTSLLLTVSLVQLLLHLGLFGRLLHAVLELCAR